MPHFRITGLLNLSQVQQQTLVVVGLGSLGSHALSLLAYPWRQLVLIDPDTLAEENVERHILGYNSLRNYKVTGLKQWLVRNRGLEASRIVVHRVTMDRVIDKYRHANLVIEATGIPSVRSLLNAWCVQNNIPAIYGGIYIRGAGGDSISIAQPQHSCLECYDTAQSNDDLPPLDNYGLPQTSLNQETGELNEVPYLSGPVAAIAADIQDMALDILTGIHTPNQCLIHVHRWEPLLTLPEKWANGAKAWIEQQSEMGVIPNLRLVKENDRFTLQGARAKITLNIQPSGGCPFHFAADETQPL
jgi:molybdopterin/thiamine biosynthesis adenylyltransferase